MPIRPQTLRAWLDSSDVRPDELARRIGVSLATIYRWRSGSVPTLAHARTLERVTRGRVSISTWRVRS